MVLIWKLDFTDIGFIWKSYVVFLSGLYDSEHYNICGDQECLRREIAFSQPSQLFQYWIAIWPWKHWKGWDV